MSKLFYNNTEMLLGLFHCVDIGVEALVVTATNAGTNQGRNTHLYW